MASTPSSKNTVTWSLRFDRALSLFSGLPAVPVLVLVAVGDIYGVRDLPGCEDPSDPYQM